MAVAVHDTLTEVDRVTAATLDVYARRRDLATEMPLAELLDVPKSLGSLRAVVASTERAIEVVVDTGVDAGSLAPGLWALAAEGWQPVVLVALDRIGEAHTELRGTPCRLQAWWIVEDEVVFGGFETP
jgi:hypothetical protein